MHRQSDLKQEWNTSASGTWHHIVFREVVEIAGVISPIYTIHQYTEEIYKVICFKGNRAPEKTVLHDRSEDRHNDVKLDNNFSRARSMVLQYALCNPWEYFFTGTLDKAKFDRFDLDTFAARLMQFIRDKRKRYASKADILFFPILRTEKMPVFKMEEIFMIGDIMDGEKFVGVSILYE